MAPRGGPAGLSYPLLSDPLRATAGTGSDDLLVRHFQRLARKQPRAVGVLKWLGVASPVDRCRKSRLRVLVRHVVLELRESARGRSVIRPRREDTEDVLH